MTTPNFVVPPIEPSEDEEPSCTFTVGERTYRCKPVDRIPASVLIAFMEARPQIDRIFKCLLIEEDQEDFQALISDTNCPISTEALNHLMEFVAENTLNRPTTQPPSFPRATRPGVNTSRANSSSAVSA